MNTTPSLIFLLCTVLGCGGVSGATPVGLLDDIDTANYMENAAGCEEVDPAAAHNLLATKPEAWSTAGKMRDGKADNSRLVAVARTGNPTVLVRRIPGYADGGDRVYVTLAPVAVDLKKYPVLLLETFSESPANVAVELIDDTGTVRPLKALPKTPGKFEINLPATMPELAGCKKISIRILYGGSDGKNLADAGSALQIRQLGFNPASKK